MATRQLIAGKYALEEKLGQGGFGTVYRTHDAEKGPCAIKVLKGEVAEESEFKRRFRYEGRALRRLNHPNIVKVYAFSEEPPAPYILMEYVEGKSLRKLIDNQELPPISQVVSYFEQILSGLKQAHEQGILHRDMQPSNILISTEGQVKIVDFGLARDVKVASNTRSIGLPPYMPLEQLRGMQDVDERSDIYSVGMCLYEALARRTPFRDTTDITAVIEDIKRARFKPPSKYVRGIPSALEKIVMKAIKRGPAERYQTAEEMLEALRDFQADFALRRPAAPSIWKGFRLGGFDRLLVPAFLMVIVILIIVTYLLVFGPNGGNGPPVPPDPPRSSAPVVITLGVYEQSLPASGPSRRGSLLLRVVPHGEVRVDGTPLRANEQTVNEWTVPVRPGPRVIRCTHQHGSMEATVNVRAGQRKEVVCYFQGTLRVRAADTRGNALPATLLEDNLSRASIPGDTHLDYFLPPGEYNMEAAQQGYHRQPRRVIVNMAPPGAKVPNPPVAPLTFVLERDR